MPRRVLWLLPVLLLGLAAPPAVAAPEPANPWQVRHWPQTQPWQLAQPAPRGVRGGDPPPLDPQNMELPDTMTWDDYRQIPGSAWADPAVKGSVRTFKGALVLVDYANQPFVVTRPPNSTIYGNPTGVHSLPRAQVPAFYRDFLNKPQPLNRGHTIHEYWMEDSGGRFGIELGSYGAYQMPAKSHEYGIEGFQGGQGCPSGDTCGRNLRADALAAWKADVGAAEIAKYDFVFYLSAGQDESSTWQEFGPMKFATKESVSAAFGSPDPALPRWNKTRYVPWTSWQAAANLWPNAGGGSSLQGESSGMSVYAHEFSHIIGIGDNYNDPYAVPARRAYSGPWEMLDRGTFNGPGGPHSRWLVPPTAGASMGAQHMLRNKLKLGIVDERNVLRLSRNALAGSGVVVARVIARSSPPGATGLSGINVALDGGDKSPACSTATNPHCDGGGYHNYTVEVVDRQGFDSFTPDSGVLLAKTKNVDSAPFIWTVDANPQDIDRIDFVRPDGTPQKITLTDYRQLSDALLHAGADSGSEYEWVDVANRLHFYVVDLRRDAGHLSYTVALRSLDGAGSHQRGVTVGLGSAPAPPPGGWVACTLSVRNSGAAAPIPPGHPEDVTAYTRADVYRISATAGSGWTTSLPSRLAAVGVGQAAAVQVFVKRNPGAPAATAVRLTARSESAPGAAASGVCQVS